MKASQRSPPKPGRPANAGFKRDAFEVKALDDVSNAVADRGPSGSGKTTLNRIAAIDLPRANCCAGRRTFSASAIPSCLLAQRAYRLRLSAFNLIPVRSHEAFARNSGATTRWRWSASKSASAICRTSALGWTTAAWRLPAPSSSVDLPLRMDSHVIQVLETQRLNEDFHSYREDGGHPLPPASYAYWKRTCCP